MTPLTPEMIERAARAIHDLMGPYLGTPEQIAKHGDRVAARQLETAEKYATVALTAALSCPDGFRLVPVEPTSAMLDRAVAFALNVTLSGEYNWSAYMRDVWRAMLAASPAPSTGNAGWRPIASAPKDGTHVLACFDRSKRAVMYWDARWRQWMTMPGRWSKQPTHWQPLPSAPSQDGDNRERTGE